MIAGTLELEMRANLARLSKDMNEAKGMVASTTASMQRSLSQLRSAFGMLGIGLGVAGLAAFVRSSLRAQDEMSKLSQKVGVSVEALAGLGHVADLSGVSMEGLTKGLKTLSTQMFDASMGLAESKRNFAALGVEIKKTDGTLKASDALMIEVADKFAKMRDGTEKTALAVKLFGRAGMDMIPMLNMGSAELAKMADEGRRLNPITAESAKQAEIFNDNLTRLGKTVGALGIKLMNDLLPVLSDLSEIFVEQALPGDIKKTKDEIDNLEKKLSPFGETIKVLVVLGGNFAYVFRTMGIAVSGVAAQLEGFQKGGIKGFLEARKMIAQILEDERKAFDAWEKQIMAAGTRARKAVEGAGGARGVPAAAVDEAAAKKHLAMLEKYRKMDADSWVKHIDAMTAEWEEELHEQARLTEEFYKNKAKLDAADQAAVFAIIDAEQEYYIAMGAVVAQDMTENHKKLEELAKKTKAEVERQAEEAKRAQVDMWREVDRVAHDTFVSIFDSGKSAFDRLRDALKNGLFSLLYQMTLRPFVVSIVASLASPGIAQAAFGAGGGGGVGNLLSGASSLNNLFSGGGIGASLFAAPAAYAAAVPGLTAFGAGSQAALLAAQTGVFGSAGLGATASAGGAAGLGAGIGALGTAIPVIGGALALAALMGAFGSKKTPAVGVGYNFAGNYSPGSGISGFSALGLNNKGQREPLSSPERHVERLTPLIEGAYAEVIRLAEAAKLDTGKLRSSTTRFDFTTAGIGQAQDDASKPAIVAQLVEQWAALVPGLENVAKGTETLEQALSNVAELARARREQEIEIMQLSGDATGALAARRELELEALDPSLRATQQQIHALQDQAVAAEMAARANEEATRAAEAAAEAVRVLAGQRQELEIRLMELTGDSAGALAARREAELAAMDASLHGLLRQIYAAQDAGAAAEALAQAQEEAAQIIATAQAQAAEAARVYRDLEIRLMRATGDEAGALAASRAREIEAADASHHAILRQIHAAEDQARALEEAARAEEERNRVIGNAEATLRQAFQRDAAELEQTISQWGDMAKSLRAFGEALTGSGPGGVSYQEALRRFAEVSTKARLGDLGAMGELQTVGEALSEASARSSTTQLDYMRDLAMIRNAAFGAATVADRQVSIAQQQLDALTAQVSGLIAINENVISVAEAIRSLNAARGVPGFAGGGFHAGGWRIVGEGGPEAEYTPPSYIFSGSQTRGMFGPANDEWIAEFRALREEVAGMRMENNSGNMNHARHLKRIDDALDRVSEGGESLKVSSVSF